MSSNCSTIPQDVVSLIAKLDSCLASGLPPYDSAVSTIYSTACLKLKDIILSNFESAIDNHLDRTLWSKLDLAIVQAYQQRLEKINPKVHPVQYRKRYQHFVYFISSCSAFYRSLLENLAKIYPSPNFVCLLEQLNWDCPARGDNPIVKDEVLLDKLEGYVQRCLVILGDLSRYRESRLPSKSRRNWESAVKYYTLAFRLNPDNWSPLNQLAVVSSNQNSVLSATYYFYRTLMTRKPCKAAQENLNLSYKKLLKSFTSDTGGSRHKSHHPTEQSLFELIDEFLLLHAKLHFEDRTLRQNAESFSFQSDKVLGLVAVAISQKNQLSSNFLSKLCVINMSAFRLSMDKNNMDNAYTGMLASLNISFMRLFLGVINSYGTTASRDSNAMIKTLGPLRLYGYWLSNSLEQGLFSQDMLQSFSSLWLEIDSAKVRLEIIEKNSSSPPSLDDILLPEDVDLLGFTCLGKHFLSGYKISDIVKLTTNKHLSDDEIFDQRIRSAARILNDDLTKSRIVQKQQQQQPIQAPDLDDSMEAMVDSLVDGFSASLSQDSDSEQEEDEVIVFRGKNLNTSVIRQTSSTTGYLESSISSTSSTSQRNHQQQQFGISASGDPIAWNKVSSSSPNTQISAIGDDRPTSTQQRATPSNTIWKSPFQQYGFS